MVFDFQGAFERERHKFLTAKQRSLETKADAFQSALANAQQVLAELKKQGLYTTEAMPSPVADWLEQFYEHGCVWLNEEMEKVTKHWMGGAEASNKGTEKIPH